MSKTVRALALCAVGAMIFSVTAASAAGATTSSTIEAGAAKKKKCKKGKKGADAAKKKKCKKKKKAPAAVPSTVRATLTWPGPADLDLNAWDTNGAQGFVGGPNLASSSFSADDPDGGTETFTDLLSPSSRQFAYGICVDSAAGPMNWTLTVRSATGITQTFDQSDATPALDSPGDNAVVTYANPPSFVPAPDNGAGGWCP